MDDGTRQAIYDHIVGLRAVRDYLPEPITDDDLDAILEAARWTGSSKNRQSWSFVVIREPGQRNALADCATFSDPARHAPVVVALIQEPEGYEFDTGRLAQNLMLAAAARGVASCPLTIHRDAEVRPVLDLPTDRRCRYAVALGYPAVTMRPAARSGGGRKPLQDLVHEERYRAPDDE